MYEHHNRLLPKKAFYNRLITSILLGAGIVSISLFIGIIGYHLTENLGWIYSLLNASMILTGMGPVTVMTTSAGKLFSSFYALFSGVVFLTTIAFVVTSVAHRFLHKFHLDEKEK